MKARLAGLGLWALLLLPALVAFVILPLVIMLAPLGWARGALRGFDHMVSAVVVGGSPYMSLSAWSWYCYERRAWARAVIWITDQIEDGHCARAYLDEAPLLAVIEAYRRESSPDDSEPVSL